MRTLAGHGCRAGNLVALVGAVLVAASAFLPIAVARQGPDVEYGGGSLLPHREGFVVLGLAAAAVLVLVLSRAGPIARILGSLGLIAIGLGSSAYAKHVMGQIEWCAVQRCPVRIGPADSGFPFRAAEPGIASDVAATGGLLLVVSAVLLAALALTPTLKRRPIFDRTHPTWM